jgi:luciferase family oxidoreductase group 1
MELKLSILDQSPVNESESAQQGFQHTVELAQKAEQWGYHRFWVAEHHGSTGIVGSSPEVLVSHLLAKTGRIRIGSGGVMLQHYSPYKVAENFNVLASLAPGRVDLGIGGGPGGLPHSTRALQQDTGYGKKPFLEKLVELTRFLHNKLEEDHPLHGLRASPIPAQPAEVFILGTTPSSAELAAGLAMPYVFALFLNNDETVMRQAVKTYRSRFDAAKGAQPQLMLALPVIAADTDDEAARYASGQRVVRIRVESGRTFTVGSVEAAEEFARQSQEKCTFTVQDGEVIHGSRETAAGKLQDIQSLYQPDELFIVTAINDFRKRLHSFELLSEAFIQAKVS